MCASASRCMALRISTGWTTPLNTLAKAPSTRPSKRFSKRCSTLTASPSVSRLCRIRSRSPSRPHTLWNPRALWYPRSLLSPSAPGTCSPGQPCRAQRHGRRTRVHSSSAVPEDMMVSAPCTPVRAPTGRGCYSSRALHMVLTGQVVSGSPRRRIPVYPGPRQRAEQSVRSAPALGASLGRLDVTWGSGGMADAHGSGPCARKGVRVQLPPSPPIGAPLVIERGSLCVQGHTFSTRGIASAPV